MVRGVLRLFGGSGLRAPARFLVAAAVIVAAPAFGQSRLQSQARPAQPQARPVSPAQAPLPDPLVTMKLIWSAIAALDHANQTGNYSVLRDLGAPSFQTSNSAATLAGIFQALRTQQVDVANALIVTPTFEIPPSLVEGGLLRARGSFPLRPVAIGFDLLFQNVAGQWRLFGIAVVPLAAQQTPQGSARR